MKKILTLAVAFAAAALNAQAPGITWQKCFGGSSSDWCHSVQPTPDGGFIAAGASTSVDGDVTQNFGSQDFWVVKTGAGGTLQWQRSYALTTHDIAYSIYPSPGGGYIVAGMTLQPDSKFAQDFWILKLDEAGDVEWQRHLAQGNSDEAYSVRPTPDGGYIVAGWGAPYDEGNDIFTNAIILKLDSNGNMQWEKSYGGSGDDGAFYIEPLTGGGYIVAGYSEDNDGDVTENNGYMDYWFLKLDDEGEIQWQKSYGGSHNELANSIKPTPDGGYIATGYSISNDGDVSGNHFGNDAWVVKLDGEGNLQWQKSFGGNGDDRGHVVHPTADGGYTVFASNLSDNNGDVSNNHGWTDYWIIRLDGEGNMLWEKSYGGSQDDNLYWAEPLADGGFIMGGTSASNNGDVTGNHGGGDFWIVKVGGEAAGVTGYNQNTISVYPNPVKDVLHFSEPVLAATVYAIDGKKVLEGAGQESLNVASLPSGLYILTLETTSQQMQNIKFVKE